MEVVRQGRHAVLLLVCVALGIGQLQARAQQTPGSGPAKPSDVAETAGRNQASPDTRVILRVGKAQVTQEEFEAGLSIVSPEGDADEKAEVVEKDRRTLGDTYAQVLMLSQQAMADHLDVTPDVSRQLAIDRLQILSNAEFERLKTQAKPTPEEISQYYAAHLSDFDEVLIRRLFVWKQHEGSQGRGVKPEDAKGRADKVRQALASGADPKKLADDLGSSNEGLLDPEPLSFPRGELRAQMEKVAFALKEGEWAEVEDTQASLILIQLVKHGRRQLGEVSSLIEVRLQGQRMQATLDEMKKKAGIWMDTQYFATAGAPAPSAQTHSSSPPEHENK